MKIIELKETGHGPNPIASHKIQDGLAGDDN